MSRPPQSDLLIKDEAAAVRLRTDLSGAATAPLRIIGPGLLLRRESINNQTKPKDVFLQHLGILLQQIMRTSSGNSIPYLDVKLDPYLLNIRRHPLEEIQYFIIVNSIWVAQLLGKFVNACENKNTLINKVVTTTGIFLHHVLQNDIKTSCATVSALFPWTSNFGWCSYFNREEIKKKDITMRL